VIKLALRGFAVRAVCDKSSLLSQQQLRQFLPLSSALLQHSGEFLKALPIPMSPKDLNLSVRSYLGMRLFPRESLCMVCHSAPKDVYGLHAINFRTTARHERLKHLLKSIAVEANLSAITEPNGLLPNSDD
jgi:hypothetical protein